MFVPLPSLTDKKGDRMNGVMNHRRGGVFQKMIMRPRDQNLKKIISSSYAILASIRQFFIKNGIKSLLI